MARTKLIISVIVISLSSQVSAWGPPSAWWPPNDVEIVPGNPTSSDAVNITLSGSWGNACAPNASVISVVDNDIYFDVIQDYPPGVHCALVVTPWWLTEEVGPLEVGSYSLYARLIDRYGGVGTYTQVAEFDVSYRGDIDITYRVDFLDFALLAEAWMSEPGDDNWDAACDISEPNDDIIDGRDLGVLRDNWLMGLLSIMYEIEDCNMAGGESGVLEGLRFSVWVEGNYIYFEDMMVANCCPEQLGLEMVTGNNLITIYEREYTPGGCWCICEYPVGATFGPFEDGVYTVEVYEDYGGFIGSTTVEIGGG